MNYIISYPRSGNHLVRFIAEFITGGYTQGCINNENDVPLFNNEYQVKDILSHVDSSNEVAIKAHFVSEVAFNKSNHLINNDGILLCIRNPFHCISSHIRKKNSSNRFIYTFELKKQFRDWLVIFEKSYINHEISVVWYEDLLEPNFQTSELSTIKAFFGDKVNDDKYMTLLSEPQYYFDISSGGKGRTWGGSESLKKHNYYFNNMPMKNKKIFVNFLLKELIYLKSKMEKLTVKYPKLVASKHITMIDKYLDEIKSAKNMLK